MTAEERYLQTRSLIYKQARRVLEADDKTEHAEKKAFFEMGKMAIRAKVLTAYEVKEIRYRAEEELGA